MAFSHLLGAFSLIVTQFQPISSLRRRARAADRRSARAVEQVARTQRVRRSRSTTRGIAARVGGRCRLTSAARQRRRSLDALSLAVPAGTRLLVTGPNGGVPGRAVPRDRRPLARRARGASCGRRPARSCSCRSGPTCRRGRCARRWCATERRARRRRRAHPRGAARARRRRAPRSAPAVSTSSATGTTCSRSASSRRSRSRASCSRRRASSCSIARPRCSAPKRSGARRSTCSPRGRSPWSPSRADDALADRHDARLELEDDGTWSVPADRHGERGTGMNAPGPVSISSPSGLARPGQRERLDPPHRPPRRDREPLPRQRDRGRPGEPLPAPPRRARSTGRRCSARAARAGSASTSTGLEIAGEWSGHPLPRVARAGAGRRRRGSGTSRSRTPGREPAAVDLVYAQDLALADYGAVRMNEYYVSQYVDHTPLAHPARGARAGGAAEPRDRRAAIRGSRSARSDAA